MRLVDGLSILAADIDAFLHQEPTSGLDSSTARSLIYTLKQYAAATGITLVMTIHQPSSQIFNMFDNLLLLSDGEVAYYGEVSRCADHFAEIQIPCPPNYNIAEHILNLAKGNSDAKDQLKAGLVLLKQKPWYPRQLLIDTSHCYKAVHRFISMLTPAFSAKCDQPQFARSSKAVLGPSHASSDGGVAQAKQSINQSYSVDAEESDIEEGTKEQTPIADTWNDDHIKYKKDYERRWLAGFITQFTVLSKRGIGQAYPKVLSKWNVLQSVVVAALAGLLWFRTEPIEEKLPDRLGLFFLLLTETTFPPIIHAILDSPAERAVLNKERLGGYYCLSAYYLSKCITNLLLVLVRPTITVTIVYWMAGLNNSFEMFIQLLLLIHIAVTIAQGIGFLYSALILDVNVSLMVGMTTMLFMLISGGFLVQEVPFWADWITYISFFRILHYSMNTIDFSNTNIKCAAVGSKFQSCIDVNSTDTYISRQELIDLYTLSSSGWELYHYIIWLIAVILVTRLATYLIIRFLRKPHAA